MPTKYLFSGLKEQNKKRIIASLLLVGCLISGYMLYATSGDSARQLRSIAHADTLIQSELTGFNIDDAQVRVSSVRIDSSFLRKTYNVGVPYQFSKTQFHAELNNRLHDFGISVPAKVTFPEEDMTIHLLVNNTVIRSLTLQTDPELRYERNRISVIMLFDDIPGQDLIRQLESMGEPIPIALKVTDPLQANEQRKLLGSRYERIIFWLQNNDGENLLNMDSSEARKLLNQLQSVMPSAHMLYFNPEESEIPKNTEAVILNSSNTFIDASNAIMLSEQDGQSRFEEALENLIENPERSIAVIDGNETTISWLQQKLPDLKKDGGDIIPPPKLN